MPKELLNPDQSVFLETIVECGLQDWCGPEFVRIQPTVKLFLPDAGVC